jgi:hypothetical protein
MPLLQTKPFEIGWSRSGSSAVIRPSSTVAISPQAGSQTRQNVRLVSVVMDGSRHSAQPDDSASGQ